MEGRRMTNEKCASVLEWRAPGRGDWLMAMEKKGNSGCRIVALIFGGIVVLFLIVVLGIYWMLTARSAEVKEMAFAHETRAQSEFERARSAAEQGIQMMELTSSDLDSLEPLQDGDAVSARHFILMMEDPKSTELARETFARRAHGAAVRWDMELEEVWGDEGDGRIGAMLRVPYSFNEGNVTRTSSLSVRAEFEESQRDLLIGLRRGDPVTVAGVLDLEGDRMRIVRAEVVTP